MTRHLCLGCGRYWVSSHTVRCPYCLDHFAVECTPTPPPLGEVHVKGPCGHAFVAEHFSDLAGCCHCHIDGPPSLLHVVGAIPGPSSLRSHQDSLISQL